MKHIDPSEINIINYLTGEMSTAELKQFELQLAENQLLRDQVEEMKNASNQLGIWVNEEIEVPEFGELKDWKGLRDRKDLRDSNLETQTNTLVKNMHLPNWMKYAAAFIGFVILLQMTGFKVNHDGNTLLLSFGEPNIESLNSNDVDEIVAKAISKYASTQNSQLSELKSQMNTDLNNIALAVDNINVKSEFSVSQLENMFSKNMDNQYVSLESMIKGIEDNQRQELEHSFTGLVEYIENKRKKDQYKIQNAFSEIATAINDQQYQTNALFTSITEDEAVLKSY